MALFDQFHFFKGFPLANAFVGSSLSPDDRHGNTRQKCHLRTFKEKE